MMLLCLTAHKLILLPASLALQSLLQGHLQFALCDPSLLYYTFQHFSLLEDALNNFLVQQQSLFFFLLFFPPPNYIDIILKEIS